MYCQRMVFCLCISICVVRVAAQNAAPALPTVTPPSPNAAAFQKYGNIPVSAYTGVPNISIPLYEIVQGDVHVPLSISYHASGIKVSEEASRVGLGWVLNAGGSISRSVNGQDDFVSNGSPYINNVSHTQPDIINGVGADLGPSFTIQNGCTLHNLGGFTDLSPYLGNPPFDIQPDQFFYNFGNHSGKFILKSSGAVIMEKMDKLDIKFLDPAASSWQITTADGTKYTFAQFETYTDFNLSAAPIKSAWYLTQILSASGNQVNFQYSTVSNYIHTIGAYTALQNALTYTWTDPSNSCNAIQTAINWPNSAGAVPGKSYNNVYLDKIVFRSGEVRFSYADDRTDIQSDRRLTGLQIYAYNEAGIAKLIKKWQLYQGYLNGSGDQDYPLGITPTYLTQRMKLDSLKEMDSALNALPPYIFHYNNESDQASSLPAKNSFARDHWGYYNGKFSNLSLIPTFNTLPSNDIVVAGLGSQSMERNTDPAYTGLWSLNQIIYPTGGNTQFQLEANDFDFTKSNVNDHTWYSAHPEGKSMTTQLAYPGNIVDQPTTQSDIAAKTIDLTNLYVDAQTPTSIVSLSAFFLFTGTQPNCVVGNNPGNIWFTFTNLTTGADIDYQINPWDYLGASSNPKTVCVNNGIAIQFTNAYNLTPGKYLWKLHISSNLTVISTVTLTLNYTVLSANLGVTYNGQHMVNADFAGGLRVKRIIDNDNLGLNPPRVKRYDYHYLDTTGNLHSYGRRMARPVYSYVDKEVSDFCCPSNVSPDNCIWFLYYGEHFMHGSDASITLNGSASGSVVGYDSVTEYIGENGENGKTLFIYDNLPDIAINYSVIDVVDQTHGAQMPRRPPASSTIPMPSNGNLLTQLDYVNINGSFIIARQVVNTYYNQVSQTQWQWYGLDVRKNPGTLQHFVGTCVVDTYVYPAIINNWITPLSTSETTYDYKNSGSSLTKTTNFYYDNATHMQLTRKFETMSDGRTKYAQIKYPADFADAQSDAAILAMKTSAFMHALPVSSTEIVTNTDGTSNVVGSIINKYKFFGGYIHPAEIAALDVTSSQNLTTFPAYNPSTNTYPTGYESRVLLDKYDAYGNIAQDHKTSDVNHTYLWDYFKTYPVAEVANADSSSVAYSSFEADGTGNWTLPDTLRNYSFYLTGRKSYSLVTGKTISATVPAQGAGIGYLVSYWSRNGAITVKSNGTAVGVSLTGLTKNGWTYYEHLLPNTTTAVAVTATSAIIDELRLYPSTAQMITRTYNPLIGQSSSCDPANHVTYYEYDNFLRLKLIRDMDGNVVKAIKYHYQTQPAN